jgi:putative glutamine amidotransferase
MSAVEPRRPPRRPLIGLPGRRKFGRQVEGLPSNFGDVSMDLYVSAYAAAVFEAGGLPVHLPVDVDPGEYAGRLDGVLLPGGTDVDPALYGEAALTDMYPPERERDDYEAALLDGAIATATPVLGICRGLQLINVHLGGSLHQHIPEHARYDVGPAAETHDVTFVPDSVLGAMYGERLAVNSLHHQTVKALADGLHATATSPDGEVEGIEHATLPIVAVQWHPEMMTGRSSDPLFAWLVAAATR